MYQDAINKLEIIDTLLQNLGLKYDEISYMGDDINDIQLLKKVKWKPAYNINTALKELIYKHEK